MKYVNDYKVRIFELDPRFDARQSFYGKAHVIDHENGVYELLSYDTIVSRCEDGKVTHLGKWSRTTSRHQREFEKQFSRTYDNTKQSFPAMRDRT